MTATGWSTWVPSTSRRWWGIIRGAAQSVGINPTEVKSTHVSIEPNSDITAPPPGAIEISVYVSPKFGNSGYIELNGDGTIKRVNYAG